MDFVGCRQHFKIQLRNNVFSLTLVIFKTFSYCPFSTEDNSWFSPSCFTLFDSYIVYKFMRPAVVVLVKVKCMHGNVEQELKMEWFSRERPVDGKSWSWVILSPCSQCHLMARSTIVFCNMTRLILFLCYNEITEFVTMPASFVLSP